MAMSMLAMKESLDELQCPHYIRRCMIITSCCDNIYKCRLCHDDKEKHQLVPDKVNKIMCIPCGHVQEVHNYCGMCGIRFGDYTCLKCRLYDDTDKQQFHCDDCGICRVGGQQNYFHCKKCNLCLNMLYMNNHKCVEDASRQSCSVCLEDMHSSVEPLHVPECFHLIHDKCKNSLKEAGRNKCPICQKRF